MPFLPSLSHPFIHWRWFTTKMLSVPIPIFFSATHLISWSQILNPLSSDHLPLLSSHHPLMVTLTLVFLRKCITSKICFLNPTLPTIFYLFSLLTRSLPLPPFHPQTHHFFTIFTLFFLVSLLYSSKLDSVLYQYNQCFENATNSFVSSLYWTHLRRIPACTLTLHLWLPALKQLNVTGEAQSRALKCSQTSHRALNPAQKLCSASLFWRLLIHTFSLKLPTCSHPFPS